MLLVLTLNIKSRFILLVPAFLAVQSSFAQKRFFPGRNEWGVTLGTSSYTGDLSHGFDLDNYKLAGGVYYRRNLSSFFAYRLQASYMKIQGTDVGDPSYNARNLTFQSQIWELGNFFEFNFQPFGLNGDDKNWTPYFFSGINVFRFDPRRLENEDIVLRNLRTEGQNRKYSLYQPSVPIGFGLKIKSIPVGSQSDAWILGIEGCWRKTFTDNLDDVNRSYPDYQATVDKRGLASAQYSHAQTLNGAEPHTANTMRGDTHLKDWYFYLGITFSYRFWGDHCPAM